MKNGQNDVIRALFFQGPFLSTNQGKKRSTKNQDFRHQMDRHCNGIL